MVPFLCPHDDFRSMSMRELALDFGDFPSSASVVRTPKRLADFKVLTIAKIIECKTIYNCVSMRSFKVI